MLNIRRILMPTDFSASADGALPWAAHLAQNHGAELHLLCAVPEREPDSWLQLHDSTDREETWRVLRHRAELKLANRESQLPMPTQSAVSESHGDPSSAIVSYAEDHGIDLIVMATHGRRGFRRYRLGSVTGEVVRRSTCPVLTVRHDTPESSADMTLETILVPIDFSWYSHLTLTYARAFAAHHGARLQLLHVISETACPGFHLMQSGLVDQDLSGLELEARRRMLQLLAEAAGPAVEASVFVRSGSPSGEIVRFARSTGSDLILMASHGLGGLLRMMLGSVASHVVHAAPCSVLVSRWGHDLTPDNASLSSHYAGLQTPGGAGLRPGL
jgi:nucleotide-binding universal stress UspA family protein